MHLRDYKYYHNNLNEDRLTNSALLRHLIGQEKWRFYQELAPYRDLNSLLEMYRYWNQYLPEAFLWHIFDSLAEAAVRMRDCEWGNMPTTRRPREKRFRTDKVVHMDIKPENIFMSYPDHRANHGQEDGSSCGGTTKYDYPVIKLGDFGLCAWTGPDGPENPRAFGRGTYCFIPPEQILYGAWWDNFGEPDNWAVNFTQDLPARDISDFDRRNHVGVPVDSEDFFKLLKASQYHFGEKTHVWSIGKVMFDLMNLARSEEYWEFSTDNRKKFIENGHHQLPDFNHTTFYNSTDGWSPYSDELSDLVHSCLYTFSSMRPDVAKLKTETSKNMRIWDGRWTPGCEDLDVNDEDQDHPVAHPKLFYRENEINDMPRGKQRFVLLEDEDQALPPDVEEGIREYVSLQDIVRSDPDWPKLKPRWDEATRCTRDGGTILEFRGTHHQHYLRDDNLRRRGFPRRWRVTPGGGLEQRSDDGNYWNGGGNNDHPPPPPPPGPGGAGLGGNADDGDNNDNDDDDGAGGGGGNAIAQVLIDLTNTATQLFGDGTRNNNRGASPMAPERPPRGRSAERPPPLPRAASPPRSLSPAQSIDDCITDPEDSDVEIAVRTLRNGRRISYYRPKRRNLRSFNREYVQHRRGEKTNARTSRWDGVSKFQDAVRRRRERRAREGLYAARLRLAWERDRRQSDPIPTSRQHSHQRFPRPPVMLRPHIHRPLSWYDKVKDRDPDDFLPDIMDVLNQTIRPPQAPQAPQPPQPPPPARPVRPAQTARPTWASGYRDAFNRAQRGELPAIPPNVDPADRTFNWHSRMQGYMRQDSSGRTWGWQVPGLARPTGAWLPVHVYPDTEQNRNLGRVGMPWIRGG